MPGAGSLFGVIFDPEKGVVLVDDVKSSLNLRHYGLRRERHLAVAL